MLERYKNQHNNVQYEKTLKEIDCIRNAILIAEELIADVKDSEAKKLIFRSRSKWAEQGEKSNKYFLNLLKGNQSKTIISNIRVGQNILHQQKDIKSNIKNFYQNLYSKKTPSQQNHNFFNNLPQVSPDDKIMLETPLTLTELNNALLTCKESSPGPDGIPYKVYKDFWDILGPKILADNSYVISI